MPVTTSAIESLVNPPLATMVPVRDEGGPYYTGDWSLPDFITSGAFLLPAGTYDIGGTYGVIVQVFGLFPPHVGVKFGWQDAVNADGMIFETRVCQLLLQHYLPLTGGWLTAIMQDCVSINTYIPWPVLLGSGSRVGLHVEPGWQVDLYYMCVL